MRTGERNTDSLSSAGAPVSDRQRAKLQLAMEYIHAHYTEHILLKDVAAVTGLSVYHFHRLFHLYFGKTLKYAITECQIELAKRLLMAGIPTREVHLRVGLSNQSHLTARFKLITGETPARWRKQQLRQAQARVDSPTQE